MDFINLEPETFSIYPQARFAKAACAAYHRRFLRSFRYLIEVASTVLAVSVNLADDVELRFKGGGWSDPWIFFAHDHLLRAMEDDDSGNSDRLLQELAQWAQRNEKGDESLKICSVGESDWERFVVGDCRETGLKDFGRLPVVEPIPADDLEKQKAHIAAALDLIQGYFSEMMEEIQTYTRQIKCFQGAVTMGLTDVRMFHCMFIRVPRPNIDPIIYYAEHIIHETSHMGLNALMAGDPIVLNDRAERYVSPIRPDPRPMLGVFHAMFVTGRIVQFFSRLAQADRRNIVLQHFVETVDELLRGVDEVSRVGQLTANGHRLLEETRRLAEEAAGATEQLGFDSTVERAHRFGAGRSRVEGLIAWRSAHRQNAIQAGT